MWTVHGVKLLPAGVDMNVINHGSIRVPASPPFLSLVDDDGRDAFFHTVSAIDVGQYLNSLCVTRDVRRIPLKPDGMSDEEARHLSLSSDGLRFFYPITIFPHNCQSWDGLIKVVSELDKMHPFLAADSKQYTVLCCDVSLYNMLMHAFYSFGGMQSLLNNVFLVFGIWHAYMYAHVALWERFRMTLLAPAFFFLFPKTKLMKKPPLFKSSVLFTWMRIAYPHFRAELKGLLRGRPTIITRRSKD